MSAISTSRRALVLGRGRSGEAAAAELRRRGLAVDFAEDYELVVASPGVPVRSELQLGCEELRRRGWKLLAVTGSKGKSSVVKVVSEAIGGVPCGNYGRPVCDLLHESPGWAVVEVSSFQLETTSLAADVFEAAAVLNLQEDHLDRHGSASAYHLLKHRLLDFARIAVVADPSARTLFHGSYFDNDVLAENGAFAVGLMRVAGLDDDAIRRAFSAFRPLPHRMNLVGEWGGVRFVDDSKATSIAALAAGVRMAGERVRLIAGGLPKGDDPGAALPSLTNRVKKVYLIGACAESFGMSWQGAVDCEICGTLEVAVRKAMRESVAGETVLLSPGAASFDQYGSFGERGDAFADLVKKEGKSNE